MIRLKVGKTYKARDGSIVTITYKDDFGSSAYPYKGDNGNTYADKGYHDISVEEHEWDLIEEVPAIGMFGSTWTFNNLKEEQIMQDQIVTLNCTLTVTTAYGEPRLEIYPKDEGWRASSVCTVLDANFELVLPRDKIDTLYTDKLLLEVRTADEAYQKALQALDKANKFLDNL